ncbi:DEAD/DEAH box helicase [Halobacillus salinus]|uniref:DEAD/DEAH box helicase n=1 Tax=Halobacillus salinus TaxID=192814 RepID=UPI0020CA743E|nr:helicase-related protein [Halobacillus salinus]
MKHAGKLLLPHDITPEDLSHYTPVPSITKRRFGYQCKRCGNSQSHLFGHMPHDACQKTCRYCRNCIQMGRVMECEPLYQGCASFEWPIFEQPLQWKGELTPWQQTGADAIKDVVINGGEVLIWAVCGAGKTEMLFPGIEAALQHGKRICLATPRADVVRELLPRLQSAFPDVPIQGLYGGSTDREADASFIIATTHQLLRFSKAFDVMIIDEIDAFPFHHDDSLKYAAKHAKKNNASSIYLTATPRRWEKWRVRTKKLPAIFIPKRFHGHPLPEPKLQLIPSLPRKLKRKELPTSVLSKILDQQNSERQLMVFLPSVAMTEWVLELLRAEGVEGQSVFAEDPDRVEKVQAFRDKKFRLMLTTTILERGVTFPSVDVFVIDAGHVVFDEAALVQIAGRAGRSPDDPDGDVRFFHGGKTNAMLDAVEAIARMNKLGKHR